MTDEGKIKNIDSVLTMFDTKTEVKEHEIRSTHDNETPGLILTMLSLGIILESNKDARDRTFVTGASYFEIKTYGSFAEYQKYKKSQLELSKKLVNSSISANWSTIIILTITVIISGVSAYISWLNYDTTKRHQESLVITTDSLSNKLLKQQIEVLKDLKSTLKYDSLKINLKIKK